MTFKHFKRQTRTARSSLGMPLVLAIGLALLWLGTMPSRAVPQVAVPPQGGGANSLLERVSQLEEELIATQAALLELQETLAHVSLEEGEVNGLAGPHLIVEGCNLHVRNATGFTDEIDGAGNLIVGYNEFSIVADEVRTGSHNLVVGIGHTYSNWGGFVAGQSNSVTGAAATVSGGRGNEANGDSASVSGGEINFANGLFASVSGGGGNEASGRSASVSGGGGNEASGRSASVSGGVGNEASGSSASVSGGGGNEASGSSASVSGGLFNEASGHQASVSGGRSNVASHDLSTVSGGFFNDTAVELEHLP